MKRFVTSKERLVTEVSQVKVRDSSFFNILEKWASFCSKVLMIVFLMKVLI